MDLEQDTITLRRRPRHGTAAMVAQDSVRYVPAFGFIGVDTVVLQLSTVTVNEDGSPGGLQPKGIYRAIISVRSAPPVVYNDPYEGIDWSSHRYLTQLHDHVGTSPWRLRAYDAAGYEVMPVMNYTGILGRANIWSQVRWPIMGWVADSILNSLQHIQMFFPSGEQIQSHHLTSPFLTRYISLTPSSTAALDTTCSTTQDCIDAIDRHGGLSFLAHPWEDDYHVLQLQGYAGLEIYSAFAAYRRETDSTGFFLDKDRNALLESRWDEVLGRDQRMWGITVNDHFGPDDTSPGLTPRVKDSGKTQVFLSDLSVEALRDAITRGAFLSIQDLGATKNQFPQVDSVVVGITQIRVFTADAVEWVTGGEVIGSASTLDLTELPGRVRYVRARVRNGDGSVVYLQPYMLRPRGDANADGRIDASDAAICDLVTAGTDTDPAHRRACTQR